MRVTFVIASLTSGGAERVMSTMANWWARHGWTVTILTIADTPPFYPLDARVTLRPLHLAAVSGSPIRAIWNNLRRIAVLARAVRSTKPDVVISFLDQTNVQTLLATRGLRRPVIVSEHTDPARTYPEYLQLGRPWRLLRRLTYPWAARVLVLTRTVQQYFPPSLQPKIVILPNPVEVAPPGEVAQPARRQLVTMGRFNREKGFDLLLDAFARVAPKHPEWDLVIWGDGDIREELESQRAYLKLEDRVTFPGRTTAPHDRLREADLYVLSSRREAFPMALAEAMGCGLPAIAFDLPSGPGEMIRHGKDGLLVPSGDMPALAEALDSLMGDDDRRQAMAAHAPEILDRYGVDGVMRRWSELVETVVSR